MMGEALAERALARGRGSVDGDDHENSAPSERIIGMKSGKAGGDEGGVVDLDRLVGRAAHHQRRHRDAMIHVGGDEAAAGHMAAAFDDQIVAGDLDLDAVDAQHGGGGFEPVGFLDAQFLQAAHDGRALGKGGRDRQHQIFVDHRRRALRRHLDAAQFRGAHAQLRHRLAGIAAQFAFLDRGAHLAQRREQAGAQRIGHHVGQHDIGAFDDQRRDDRKCRRRRIGRHHDVGAVQFGLPGRA